MDSDEFDDIPEVESDFVVQPYMFEPTTSNENRHESSDSESSEGSSEESDSEEQEALRALQNMEW